MKPLFNLTLALFVKPFYKENAGALVFVYTLMFFVVSTLDGAGMFAYHYSLVSSMLSSPVVYFLVFFLWLLYARKCAVFVSDVIRSPQCSFLYILNSIPVRKRFVLFLFVNAFLMLPLLSYAVFIVYAGLHQHVDLPVVFAVFYLLLLCAAMAVSHAGTLHNPQSNATIVKKLKFRSDLFSRYPLILLSFVANEHKAIWLGVKIYSCGVLYLIARYNTEAAYDTLVPFLFFNFGLLANGVLMYLIRQFEESTLSFYKSLPVSLVARFKNYALVYAVLLLPEWITILSLMLCIYTLQMPST